MADDEHFYRHPEYASSPRGSDPRPPAAHRLPRDELSRPEQALVADIVSFTVAEARNGVRSISFDTILAEFVGGTVTPEMVLEATLNIELAASVLR